MIDNQTDTQGIDAIAADILGGSSESTDSNESINENQDQVLQNLATELLGVDTPVSSDQEPEQVEEAPVSDNNEKTEEESDVESPDEVEEVEEVEDEPTDEVTEYFNVEYEDAKDGIYPIKINGEVKMMKFGEIQNQLARAESASKKSQEANQQLEEITAKQAELDNQQAWLNQQTEAVTQSKELAAYSAQLQDIHQKYNKAAQAKDSHNMILLQNEAQAISQKAKAAQDKVLAVQTEQQNLRMQEVVKEATKAGYGNLFTAGKEADQFLNYTKTALSTDAQKSVVMDPTLIALVEKARKWDASQGKGKRTLKKSKTLHAGGGNIKQAKTNKQVAINQAMAAGQGSQKDAEAAIKDIANNLLGL